jgi:hypothetical protein
MRATTLRRTSPLALCALFLSAGSAGAQANPVHAHIGHVADAFNGTPNGMGLLPTAVAEAEIAAQHATFAAQDPSNLDAMKRHAGHVLHAIDPTLVQSGPGRGYGLKQAASGAARHIEMAASAQGASENVRTHATHVATSANNVVQRADAIIALAQQIQASTSATEAAALVQRLATLAGALVPGTDANGDGRVSWEAGEGGLQQATQHMTLLKRGEGLAN